MNSIINDVKYVNFENNQLKLTDLGEFCSFDYIVFNSKQHNPYFKVFIYIGNDILLTIYSDLIRSNYIKKINDKYMIKLPINELIDTTEIYSKIFNGNSRVVVESNEQLENIKLVYNIKILTNEHKDTLGKYLYNLQIKQIKEYSYDKISNILFNDHVYGIYIKSITPIEHVKLKTSLVTHNLDKELIDMYCKQINENIIYIPFNMISTYTDHDIKYTLKLENENIKLDIDTNNKDNLTISVVIYKNINI